MCFPQGFPSLHLPRSQWRSAFPLFENHLDKLASIACRLLGVPERQSPSAVRDRSPVPRWRRFITGHIAHLHRFGSSRSNGGKARTMATASYKTSLMYESRKVAHEAA